MHTETPPSYLPPENPQDTPPPKRPGDPAAPGGSEPSPNENGGNDRPAETP